MTPHAPGPTPTKGDATLEHPPESSIDAVLSGPCGRPRVGRRMQRTSSVPLVARRCPLGRRGDRKDRRLLDGQGVEREGVRGVRVGRLVGRFLGSRGVTSGRVVYGGGEVERGWGGLLGRAKRAVGPVLPPARTALRVAPRRVGRRERRRVVVISVDGQSALNQLPSEHHEQTGTDAWFGLRGVPSARDSVMSRGPIRTFSS